MGSKGQSTLVERQNVEFIAVARSESKRQVVVVVGFKTAVMLVAHKELLDGDGIPIATIQNTLNLAILIYEIAAEITTKALAHERLDSSDNILRDIVQLAAEVNGVASDDAFNTVQRLVAAANGLCIATVIGGVLHERSDNHLRAIVQRIEEERRPSGILASLACFVSVLNFVVAAIKTLEDDFLHLPETFGAIHDRNGRD